MKEIKFQLSFKKGWGKYAKRIKVYVGSRTEAEKKINEMCNAGWEYTNMTQVMR